MRAPEESVGAAVTGGLAGDFAGLGNLGNELDYLVDKMGVDAATAGDVRFDLEELAAFYNALSDVHEQLATQVLQLRSKTVDVAGQSAGGAVTGVQRAWEAIARSMGTHRSSNSLIANIEHVDGMILGYMENIRGNVERYAANENYAVQGFGKAGESGGGGSGGVGAVPQMSDGSFGRLVK